jgi:hypothetical protein
VDRLIKYAGIYPHFVMTCRHPRHSLQRYFCFGNSYDSFYKVYAFTFGWVKDHDAKNLSLEEALAYWTLLFTPFWTHLDSWIEFIRVCLNAQALLFLINTLIRLNTRGQSVGTPGCCYLISLLVSRTRTLRSMIVWLRGLL